MRSQMIWKPLISTKQWLVANWLIVGYLAVMLSLATIRLAIRWMVTDQYSQPFRFEGFFFFTAIAFGFLMTQPGIVALWCAFATGNSLRRFNRAILLLLLNWMMWSFLEFRWPANRGMVVCAASCQVVLFVPALAVAWLFRFARGWRIVCPENELNESGHQFALRDLFRLLTLSGVILGLIVSIPRIFRPTLDAWEGIGYFILFCGAGGANLLIVPLLIFLSWGCLSESLLRAKITAAAVGGILCLVGFYAFFANHFHFFQGQQAIGYGLLFAGICLPPVLTAFFVRRAGYRLVRLGPIDYVPTPRQRG